MLLEKLREEEHFTNHEKDVVRYILDRSGAGAVHVGGRAGKSLFYQ